MNLSIKVIFATGIFAIVAIAITSLSVRQVTATKKSDGKILEAMAVSSTFNELEQNAHSLTPGNTTLPDVVIDGRTYKRALTVEEISGKKLLDIQLEVSEETNKPRPQIFRTSIYRE